MVYGTSNGPRTDVGNSLGPCSMSQRDFRSGRLSSQSSVLFVFTGVGDGGVAPQSLASQSLRHVRHGESNVEP